MISARSARWWSVAIAVAVLGLTSTGLVLELRRGSEELDPLLLVALLLVGLIGAILVAKRPSNRVSWLLAAAGVSGAIAALTAAAVPEGPDALTTWQIVAMLLGGPAWYGFIVLLFVVTPWLFPTGRPLTPRWRWVGWAVTLTIVGISALYVVQERFCIEGSDEEGCLRYVINPIGVAGVENPEEGLIGSVLLGALLVSAVAAMVSLVVRYRRARGVERQQLKWLVFAVAAFVAAVVLVETIWLDVLGNEIFTGYYLFIDLLWVAIPVSIAVAILRYRLYEIDRIINRTVVYGVVVGLLVAVYVSGVFLLRGVLPGQQSDLAVAGSTLAVAALFTPLRRRVQRWVDRRFYRSRYNAQQVVEGFSARLRDEVDLAALTAELAGVVQETVRPTSVGVWVKEGR